MECLLPIVISQATLELNSFRKQFIINLPKVLWKTGFSWAGP